MYTGGPCTKKALPSKPRGKLVVPAMLLQSNICLEKYAAVTPETLEQAAAEIFRKENSNTIKYFSTN